MRSRGLPLGRRCGGGGRGKRRGPARGRPPRPPPPKPPPSPHAPAPPPPHPAFPDRFIVHRSAFPFRIPHLSLNRPPRRTSKLTGLCYPHEGCCPRSRTSFIRG